MPVDTSIYDNLKTPNPLETLSNLTNLQSTTNQNKLFQQEYNSKLGMSQIYKEAIDPETGQINPQKLNQLIAGPNSGNITLGLPQAIQNSQQAQQRNVNIDTSQLQNAQNHLTAIYNYMGPLMAKPDVSSSDVVGAIGHAIGAGLVKPDEAAQFYGTLPKTPQGQIDESQIPNWLQQTQLRLMSAQERLNAISPAPTMVNNGQFQRPMRLPQIGAPSQAGPDIQNQLPPTTPTFNQHTNQFGYLGATGGAGSPAGGGSGPGGGFVPSGPPLGAGAAADVDATAGANQGVALQGRSDQVPTNKALLGNLGTALNQFTSGPGSDWKAMAKKFANSNSPFGAIFDPKSIASQEEFIKQATQLAQSQFQQLGGTGANAQLESAMHTSPNTELSQMGNRGIIALLKGNEDAIQAKNQAWQQYKQQNGPQSYGQFSTQFNKSYDPRVFQGQYLAPAERQKMIEGMNSGEKKVFANSLRTAISNGWITPTSGQ